MRHTRGIIALPLNADKLKIGIAALMTGDHRFQEFLMVQPL
jgi:hypothetical protein